MATTTTRDILKSYFQTGKYPTEGQFAELIDSMRHQGDVIGMDKVNGLYDALNSKADKAQVDLKDYAEAGKVLPLGACYVYYGMPTHARTLDALDTDFDPEATAGDTTQVVAFCCGHGDDTRSGKGTLYLVYGSTNSGYAYYARFTNQTVPEDILRAFGEAVATSSADGLMSKADKAKLDKLAEVVALEDYINDASMVLPLGKIYTYDGDIVVPTLLYVEEFATVLSFRIDSGNGAGSPWVRDDIVLFDNRSGGFKYWKTTDTDNNKTCPNYIKVLYGRRAADEDTDGLMSAADKTKLDELPTAEELETVLEGKADKEVLEGYGLSVVGGTLCQTYVVE